MRKGLKRGAWPVFALILLFASSCATRYRNALFTSNEDPPTDSLKSVYVANNRSDGDLQYRIQANDLLAIRNLQDIGFISPEEESGLEKPTTFLVEDNGKVTLPVVGTIEVVGLTRRQAANKIQSLYKEKLLKDPIIEVSIVNLKVTVLGEFTQQGNYLLERENTNLIDIIGEAGGITERANPKSLKIIRGDKQNPEQIYVNLNNINSLANPKLILKNNDIIYIEPQASYGTDERTKSFSTLVQPAILILNAAILIYNVTR